MRSLERMNRLLDRLMDERKEMIHRLRSLENHVHLQWNGVSHVPAEPPDED